MKAGIDLTFVYPHPIERVWAALTSPAALATWLMPNDFEPVVGHRFTFRTRPAPGFDGIVRCQVLELDPPRRMVWSWAGGNIDTTVTFTLEPSGDPGTRTRLRLRHTGFDGLGAQLTRRILANGYPGILGRRLPAYLGGKPAAPGKRKCAEGWRAYLNLLRRGRRTSLDQPAGKEKSHHGTDQP